MGLLDEIKESREQAPQQPNPASEAPVEVTVETPASEVIVETPVDSTPEQTTENNQPAQEQTTTNQNTVEITQEKSGSTFANEEVARINAYLTKYPEKTIDDYKALTTPTDQLNEQDLIRSYLSEKEGKTKSQIDYALKNLELKEVDPDFDGEFGSPESDLENLKKKGELEALVKQAREWREEYVKSELSFDTIPQNTEQASQEAAPSIEQFIADAKKQQEAYTQNYLTKIYEALPTLDSIDLEIQGKTVSFVPDEEFKTEMRKGAEDISQIGKEYFDETGNILDAKGFISNNTLWANPKTREKLLAFVIDQAVQNDRANTDKARRNITLADTSGKSIPESSNRGDVVEKILAKRKNGSF